MNALFGNVPKTTPKQAILVLVMNILLPGSGTMLIGCLADPKNADLMKTGVFQFISAIFVVGWIWSIWYGIEVVKKAGEAEEERIKRKVDDLQEPFHKAERDIENAKDKVADNKNETENQTSA
jgi:hypothetical protein